MAVYTALDEGELAALLQGYGLPEHRRRIALEGGVSNSNWRIEFGAAHAPLVLTVVEPAMAPSELEFVLSFQQHLETRRIRLAAPLPRLDGTRHGSLAGKPALLSPFLAGRCPEVPNAQQAAQLGAMLARMHIAAGDFGPRRSNPMGLPDMAAIVHDLDPLAIEAAVPGLASELAVGFSDVLSQWPQGLPAGAVHCDLFPDNVLFDDDRLSGVIDFYFSCVASYSYDLAMTLASWSFNYEGSGFRPDISTAILAAYEELRPLSAEERSALPLFARAACLRILATRLRDWIAPRDGVTVTPKHPADFAARLRFYSSDRGARAFAP